MARSSSTGSNEDVTGRARSSGRLAATVTSRDGPGHPAVVVVPSGSGSFCTVARASAGTFWQSLAMRLLMSGRAALAKSFAPATSVANEFHAGSLELAALAALATFADAASSGWASAGVMGSSLTACAINSVHIRQARAAVTAACWRAAGATVVAEDEPPPPEHAVSAATTTAAANPALRPTLIVAASPALRPTLIVAADPALRPTLIGIGG